MTANDSFSLRTRFHFSNINIQTIAELLFSKSNLMVKQTLDFEIDFISKLFYETNWTDR